MRDSRPAWTLVAAILASGMAMIDSTAVNVALPMMQRGFNATAANLQWVVEGYALFLSAFILLGGALGDKIGRRKVFAAGLALFAVASVACALAQSIEQLIVFRCVQGVGGALVTPGSLSLISAAYTQGAARGRAIGTWSAFGFITTAIGPLLGGWLSQTFSWRYVFVINIPLAAIVTVLAWWKISESRDPEKGPLDLAGSLLAVVGLGALVFGLIGLQGRIGPLPIVATLLGVLVLVAFLYAERRVRLPILPLKVFGSRQFSVANLYTLLLYAALGGSLYFVPFDLIDVHRYTPLEAGAALLPTILISFSLSRYAGGLVARIGPRRPLIFGALVTAIGFLGYARIGTGGSYWTTFFPVACILGIGIVSFVAPLTTTVMNALSTDHAGVASGINNAVARTAGLIAIAVFGIALAATFNAHFDRAMTATPLSASASRIVSRQRAVLVGGRLPPQIPTRDRAQLQRMLDASFTQGFRAAMILAALLCACAAASAFALNDQRTTTS